MDQKLGGIMRLMLERNPCHDQLLRRRHTKSMGMFHVEYTETKQHTCIHNFLRKLPYFLENECVLSGSYLHGAIDTLQNQVLPTEKDHLLY